MDGERSGVSATGGGESGDAEAEQGDEDCFDLSALREDDSGGLEGVWPAAGN